MTKEEFLKDIGNWSNHRYLLWPALEQTTNQVIEFGCGDGSTPYLYEYCKQNNREFLSFDNNPEWAQKYSHLGVKVVDDWDKDVDWDKSYSVALIDEAPGGHRKKTLSSVRADIVIIHDSEPAGWNSSNYEVRDLFDKFKYKFDLKSEYQGGAWATALSNIYDVSIWEM